jgi:Tat protein translocase TatB subunit
MNLGFTEMAFIFVLALIIFGPKKLPEIGRQIGKFMAEFKRASNEFKWQLESEMRQIEAEATRERLIKAAPETKVTDNGETKPLQPAEGEIVPTTFGLEFRPKETGSEPGRYEPGSELVDPETVRPEEFKGPNA